MKKPISLLEFPIFFGLGYSLPEVMKGNFIWLLVFIPSLIYTVIRIYKLFKK